MVVRTRTNLHENHGKKIYLPDSCSGIRQRAARAALNAAARALVLSHREALVQHGHVLHRSPRIVSDSGKIQESGRMAMAVVL